MGQAKIGWKWAIALFSLLLTVLIWRQGLKESFDRPSVAPRISLMQTEMAVSASSSVPESIKDIFLDSEPQKKLYQTLKNISFEQIDDRQRLLLAVLEESESEQKLILKKDFKDKNFETVKKYLLDRNKGKELDEFPDSNEINLDPLLYQTSCLRLGFSEAKCINKRYNSRVALRLLTSQLLPFIASFLGTILLINYILVFLRKKNTQWPEIIAPPLSLIDMVLLISGGFVVIGEVVFPALVIPITDLLFNNLSSPLKDSLRVLIGYCSMTIGPLLIIRYQLMGIVSSKTEGGWLQWKIKPIKEGILKALAGWLMIMPLVLLVGWLMNEVIGDQGGSNPLLELVLSSDEFIPLFFLLITTVVLAPVFEELVFRGVLLPVLVSKVGKISGVLFSALIFALAHLSVGELPPLFVLGVGLGLMRLSSGRLFPCALMHSLWNGVTFASLMLVA
ncbi:CPBP family intramembrane glutamic endopeptidase [Prochlorococcus marinus]|uniref:CPBP family intramembrane metalloprotease domain-containing protein n=1 Tax=Prochlorococcus marinus XMU1408 TaxID=2213228 RepID=A0A318R518_PROMR|nr:type II CAAX endopeptidase family protein [Prochlorococcus marinus]MBW3041543.1 CPBP family intramembrane metalloprotease domain-containing protein [Prochlorococcus marinus str. XMU1408]PYE02701.1 CPBP family intramembrane metalloprotease domain-containing protein [Prochlorococcus marinus XMU1408]